MFKETKVFSSFSVSDIDKAKEFYGETLELEVAGQPEGLAVQLAGGGSLFIYPKPNHSPASFTVLNFSVDDIEKTVEKLKTLGITFEQYDTPGLKTDDDGIYRGDRGPMIAWFKDPAGNILSVLQEK